MSIAAELPNVWAAGLFEGEGCTSWSGKIGQNGRAAPRFTLCMTDKDVVERFARIMGVGCIYERPLAKPQWSWQTTNRPDFYKALGILYPWVGERRQARMREIVRMAMAPKRSHCKRGHALGAYVHNGSRHCRLCAQERYRRAKNWK